MKTNLPTDTLIPFPVPQGGSALGSVNPPSVPAFPIESYGNDILVAVPVLLMLPVGYAGSVSEVISDAVAIVRSSEILVEGVPVGCVSLAKSDELQVLSQPSVRNQFLAMMIEAAAKAKFTMSYSKQSDSCEIDRVVSETMEVLHILNSADFSTKPLAS